MDIQIEMRDDIVVVRPTGSLDAVTAPLLSAALGEQITAGRSLLVADLAALEYVSSAGLQVLMTALKGSRHAGGDFRLAAAVPAVRRVLEMTGFTSVFHLHDDLDDAIAKLQD